MKRLTLEEALRAARETRSLDIGQSILKIVPQVFRRHFDQQQVVVVADSRTFQAAGNEIVAAFHAAGQSALKPFVFADDDLYAEHRFVERLEAFFSEHRAIPVAVGSGTINDLVKLAAHRTGRQYVCVATAASMELPPRRSTSRPTWVAYGDAVESAAFDAVRVEPAWREEARVSRAAASEEAMDPGFTSFLAAPTCCGRR